MKNDFFGNLFNEHPEFDDSDDARRAFEESNEMSDDSPHIFEKGFIFINGPEGPVKVEMSPSDLEQFKKNPDGYARALRENLLIAKSDFWRKMLRYRRFPVLGGEYLLFMTDILENENEATVFMEIHPNPEAKHSISLVDVMGSPNIQQYIAFCVSWEYGLHITDYHDLSMKMIVEDLPDKKSAKISIIAHCDRRTLHFIQDTSPIDWISNNQESVCMDSQFLGKKYHSQLMYVKHIYEPVFGVEGLYTFGGLEEINFMDDHINTEKVFIELCRPLLIQLVNAIYPKQCVSSILAWSDMKYVHFSMDIERSHKMIKITVYGMPGYITNEQRVCNPVSYFGNRELLMNANEIGLLDPEAGGNSFNPAVHWMELCSSQFSQVFTLTALNKGYTVANGDVIIPMHYYEVLFLLGIMASESSIEKWNECAFADGDNEVTHPTVSSCTSIPQEHLIVLAIHVPEEPAYLPENPCDPGNHLFIQVMGFVDCKPNAIMDSNLNLREIIDPFITKYMGVPVGSDRTTWSAKNAYVVHCYDSDSIMRFAVIAQTIGPYVEASDDTSNDTKK